MRRAQNPAETLAMRLCRPQRLGVFGHRGVGKTTLLTMLYREAVGGRLADLRLAAADVRTADYLAEKILQLESGQLLPATLAETDLRLHLYGHDTRLELLVRDYQGEHVELGRDEPIRAYLRDCDALWLCLDASTLACPAERLRRQQEVEQLLEDYLAVEPQRIMDRPVALLLTKADQLGPAQEAAYNGEWLDQFDMIGHALQTHCRHSGLFAVSSLCLGAGGTTTPSWQLETRNLAAPLTWLVTTLQAHDEARLEQLWSLGAGKVDLLERCVACYARRYPGAPALASYRQRLRDLRRRRRQRRGLLGSAAAACLVAGLATYDLLGYQQAVQFEAEHAGDPSVVLHNWQTYQAWHPTRHFVPSLAGQREEEHLRALQEAAHRQQGTNCLAELRRQSALPEADPDLLWQQLQAFRVAYPELRSAEDIDPWLARLQVRRDEQRQRRAQRAYDELIRAEQQHVDLALLLAQVDQFLRDYSGSPYEPEVRRRRDAYVRRLDERAIEGARDYSARRPLNFQTRREHYQHYLDKHPAGAFVQEAQAALRTIATDWDKHDFRTLRDHYVTQPGDLAELVARVRTYLAVHPQGQFTAAARALLRWSERVTTTSEYRVVLRSGQFEHKIARLFSRGPDLSVELEVAGIRYGPSTIITNRYDPDWNYEFPRRIRWRMGDPVRIRVTDHDYWRRVVLDIASAEGEPFAIRLVSGEAWSGKNSLTFESDFSMPTVPTIE